MSNTEGQSLLTFLDAPVLVGDPEGRVVFANPAFRRRFCGNREVPLGDHLAALFAGGGRESMLAAVAEVCTKGESIRFRLREEGRGYLAVASPIEAEDHRVGVLILLTDEPLMDERLLDFHREIQEPLEETMECLDELIEQTGGRRDERYRSVVERGIGSLSRARKWSEELHGLICGSTVSEKSDATMNPTRVVQQVVARLEPECARAKVELDLLLGSQIPMACGDGTLIETVLVRLLRQRLAEAPSDSSITLLAREMGQGISRGVLLSIVDPCVDRNGEPLDPEEIGDSVPRLVRETIEVFGARLLTVIETPLGRVTSIRLRPANV